MNSVTKSNHKSEYNVWSGMIHRCHNPKRQNYPRYGGRGIKVCGRWRQSFAAFVEDMGPRPSMTHQLDRIDNDGDYEPSNCRWATLAEQQNNKRTNRMVTAFGKTQTVCEWSRESGVERKTLSNRLDGGMEPEEALTKPTRTRPLRHLEAFGKKKTVAEWVRETGIARNTIFNRLRRGWSPERSLSEPIGEWPAYAKKRAS